MATRGEVTEAVLGVLKEVQELSGRKWSGLSPGGKPIGDLPGFDSLSSVEATILIEEKLQYGPLKVDSVFLSPDGKRALTLNEIASRLMRVEKEDAA